METEKKQIELDSELDRVLGYLNFSSGKPDPKFLAAMNRLYAKAIEGGDFAQSSPAPQSQPTTQTQPIKRPRARSKAGRFQRGSPYVGLPAWVTIEHWLMDRLDALQRSNPIYAQCEQARSGIRLVWKSLLPDYLDFHRDLLFHQEPEGIFNGLFLGRAIEAVLQQGGNWDDTQRIVPRAIEHLNDYVGFRPVATLEGHELEPYPHEWFGTIPLYIRDVGVADGPYHDLIERAKTILLETSPALLREAQFDPDLLDEIALDPRAYDFDHPVNKRPNYYFGQWDPHRIDTKGYYRRFILQQVTVDALMARVSEAHAQAQAPTQTQTNGQSNGLTNGIEGEIATEELLTEAAAVLAGTMLMASGISGASPTAIASTTSLGDLMGHIAKYRDAFYEEFLKHLPKGEHRKRLESEAQIRRQPLGGARQELNTTLGRLRAAQVERIQVARIFARMGSAKAAKEESDDVQVPSARILCRIDCLLTTGNQLLRHGEIEKAAEIPEQIDEWIHRGIACGALVDPWNILGFAGNFNRFVGSDATVIDDRVHELVQIMEQTFALLSRIWREAAARDEDELCKATEKKFRQMAEWWRQYAAHEVSDIHATDPKITLESSELVARALRLWHRGGAAAGDLKFWTPHASLFDSPKAYALVIEALLDRDDFVGAKALLIHWLYQSDRVGLTSGSITYSDLARRWIERLLTTDQIAQRGPQATWALIENFFDSLEANAEQFWLPPVFQLGSRNRRKNNRDTTLEQNELEALGIDPSDADSADRESDELDEDTSIQDSAYQGVSYVDSTNDGHDGSVYEGDTGNDEEFIEESKRIGEHLIFLSGLAHMWKQVAQVSVALKSDTATKANTNDTQAPSSSDVVESSARTSQDAKINEAFDGWIKSCLSQRAGLVKLLDQVHRFSIPNGGTDTDSMTRYDRQRVAKESLLERILLTAVETSDASRFLLATQPTIDQGLKSSPSEEKHAIELYSGLMAADHQRVQQAFPQYVEAILPKPLLYVSLARGGNPIDILTARARRRTLSHLLMWLPRQGFYQNACDLIGTARNMEMQNHVGHGAVTEFDDLFQNAFKAMVRALIRNAYQWSGTTALQPKSNPKRRTKRVRDYQSNDVTPSPDDLAKLELDEIVDLNLPEPDPEVLVPLLEQLTENLLSHWLSHSRTLRLSVLESVDNTKRWDQLSNFIQRYGKGIFTQGFLRLAHVRAILHQGVGNWLRLAMENQDSSEIQPILDAIETGELPIAQAEQWLAIVFEAIIDHFAEYKDYNSTTTQSDRGEMLYMFLDFLRLRVRYDRVCWNFKPVFWTHEVLVHAGCQQSANQWRRALSDRVSKEAESYLNKLKQLQQTYAMKMPSVADRLNERFIKPMTIDRMRALIRPAMRQLRTNDSEHSRAFDLLVQEAHIMMREPTGVGLEIPSWLVMLEEEVDRVLDQEQSTHPLVRLERTVQVSNVTLEHVQEELRKAQEPPPSLPSPRNPA